MPASKRLALAGGVFHIFTRAENGRAIFQSDDDAADLVRRIEYACSWSGTRVYAWTLTPGAVHLLLRHGRKPMGIFMKRILSGYVLKYNRKYRTEGPLFSGRYGSTLIEEDSMLLDLVRDIHAIPFYEKQVETLARLDSYRWSGHQALLGNVTYSWQDCLYVLREFSRIMRQARAEYREFMLNAPLDIDSRPDLSGAHYSQKNGSVDGAVSSRTESDSPYSTRILGSADFARMVIRKHSRGHRSGLSKGDRARAFDSLLQAVIEELGVTRRELFGRSKRKPITDARACICYLASFELGMTYVDIAERMGITPSGVYSATRRGRELISSFSLQGEDLVLILDRG